MSRCDRAWECLVDAFSWVVAVAAFGGIVAFVAFATLRDRLRGRKGRA